MQSGAGEENEENVAHEAWLEDTHWMCRSDVVWQTVQ